MAEDTDDADEAGTMGRCSESVASSAAPVLYCRGQAAERCRGAGRRGRCRCRRRFPLAAASRDEVDQNVALCFGPAMTKRCSPPRLLCTCIIKPTLA
jgi:hypothetical protein